MNFKKFLADLLSYRLCLIPIREKFQAVGCASSSGELLQAVMKHYYRKFS